MSRIYPDDWYCSGVYMITNKATGERYVGASKTVCDRIQQHFTREPTLPRYFEIRERWIYSVCFAKARQIR